MTPEEQERQRQLEEIRRRSEEDELKRIEEEEHGMHENAPPEKRPSRPSRGFPTVFAPSHMESAPPASRAVIEQRVAALRERFLIAIDRGRHDKASEILKELGTLLHDGPELQEFQERLRLAEAEKARARERRKSSQAPAAESAPVKQSRNDTKRLMELLESANTLYQQEKYDDALRAVDEALALVPGNEDAIHLRDEIQRAGRLAESIRLEEAKHREEEASLRGPSVGQPPPQPLTVDHDPWGTASTVRPHTEIGYDLMPEERGPVGPPKPPLLKRMARSASRIRIPVRPLLVFLGVIITGVAIYLVVDSIRSMVVPPRYSILVLPADPQGGDSALTELAAGITNDLISSMIRIADLRVINPVSAFNVRFAAPSVAARSFGANYYVQWGIARVPTGIAVTLALHDTLSGAALWSMQREAPVGDLPVIMRGTAAGILGAMKIELPGEGEASLGWAAVTAPGAYESYARGRLLQWHPDQQMRNPASTAFAQAVKLDAGFVPAWSALGLSYIQASESGPRPSKRLIPLAIASTQKALDLGSQSAETYLAWALIELEQAQYDKAVKRLEEATSLVPGSAEIERRLAVAYVIHGETEPALKAARRAVGDDPGNVLSYTVLGLVHQSRREYEDAKASYERGMAYAEDRSAYASGAYADVLLYLQQHDRAIALLTDRVARVRQDPDPLYKLSRVQQSAGRPKKEWTEILNRARNLLAEQVASNPGSGAPLAQLALVQTRLGEFREALASSAQALKLAPDDVGVLYATARMHALQRNKERALEYLRKAIDSRYSLAAVLDLDFYNLHSDPEFQQALVR